MTLRPEIELCYVGIIEKCFEILETRSSDISRSANPDTAFNLLNNPTAIGNLIPHDDDSNASAWPDDDDDDNDHDSDDDTDDDDGAVHGLLPVQPPLAPTAHNDTSNDEDEAAVHTDSTSDDNASLNNGVKRTRLRVREILFYDDKVSIFKARHGEL